MFGNARDYTVLRHSRRAVNNSALISLNSNSDSQVLSQVYKLEVVGDRKTRKKK